MTTKQPALLLVVSLCQPVLLLAQVPAKQKANSASERSSAPGREETAVADYSKEPYVFELIQTKFRFEVDGKGQKELTIRARVQSESGVRELGLLAYGFASSFESLDVVYARVRKPDGTVVETPQSDVQELDSAVSREAPMYSDTREKHIAIKSLAVGDVIEGQLRWTAHDAIAPGRFWMVDSFFRGGICLKETKEFDLPKAAAAKLESKDVKPSMEEKGDRQIYRFESANLNKQEESKIPDWERNFYGSDPPEVRLTSFHSWGEVGAWFAGLLDGKVGVTPEIKAKADELTKGKATEEEKIRALYEFVSTRFRYIGVDLGAGRYIPHAAADVLANRYGDCKDKHTLFAALLNSIGVKAYPALISSHFRVDPAFPSPDLFDHVITAIPQGDHYFFLDTTPEVAPYGLLLAGLRDREALVMPSGASANLRKTPAEPPFHAFEKVTIESSIDTEGTLNAKMQIESRGDGEVALRAAYRATPQNRWDELTQTLAHGMGFAGKTSDVSVGQPEDTSRPFVLSFSYHRAEFPDWKNHQISLPAPSLILVELTDEQKLSKQPLPLGIHDITYESTVKLPNDYTAILPKNIRKRTGFAEFSAEYQLKNDGALHGRLHWQTFSREAPGENRDQYVELTKAVEEVEQRYIPITGRFLMDMTDPGTLAAMLNGQSDALPKLEKAAEMQPENLEITLMLAEQYKKADRAKDAAAFLDKRLATSPKDAFLNVAAGEAHLAVGESEKAIELFKNGLDADPQPYLLNNAAYSLAEAKYRLNEAESYSKQSLTALSTEISGITAEAADLDDFGLMVALAKFWDTLGWIEFQKGDFEKAENYLAASWELEQNPVTAEHLVQVYEKRNKLPRAAKLCAMAQRAFGHEAVDAKLREEMKRIGKNLPPNSPDPSVALSDMRTLQIPFHPKLQTEAASAKVVIVFDREGDVDVAFPEGAPQLENSRTALARFKYPQTFPDDTAVKIVRTGILNCNVYSNACTVILVKPTDAAGSAN